MRVIEDGVVSIKAFHSRAKGRGSELCHFVDTESPATEDAGRLTVRSLIEPAIPARSTSITEGEAQQQSHRGAKKEGR